jgi:dTMP kinase
MTTKRGRFIVFEGIDGSGTSTQTKLIAQWLEARGRTVIQTCQPSNLGPGKLCRQYLRAREDPQAASPETLALMFAADRLHHVRCVVEPALSRGYDVICDRYVVSSWVYQALDCDPKWVRDINRHATWPDYTFVFDVPAEVAFARVEARRGATGEPEERFDKLELQRRLAAGYTGVLVLDDLPGLICVDATPGIEEVSSQLEFFLSGQQPFCSYFDIDGPCGHDIPCPCHGARYQDTREWANGDDVVTAGCFLGRPSDNPYPLSRP